MKRVCARQRSQTQKGEAVRPAKGVWPIKGEPMTSRKQPPGETGGHSRATSAPRLGAARAVASPASRRLRDQFPATVGRALAIPFYGSAGVSAEVAARNADKLEQALILLGHSPTGRQLIEELAKSGYGICFDDKKTEEQGAIGLCDPHAKRLIMRSSTDSDELALFLAHEAVHALQNERDDDLLPSTHHRPETVFRLSFAIEADAYAQQAQVAFELARAKPAYLRPLMLMRGRFPIIMRAGERALIAHAKTDRDQGVKALNDGRVLAAMFNAFYDDASLRSFYETSHLDWMKSFAEKHAAKQSPKKGKAASAAFNAKSGVADMFRHDMPNARILQNIRWRGRAYLQEHRADIDFKAPRYSGVSAAIRDGIQAFYRDWLTGRRVPDVPSFGLVVAADNKTPPPAAPDQRPVKAPRKRKRDFW